MKLLVVEDDPTLQQALRRLLVQWGYAADTASTAAEALAWLEQERFDLVLLDLGLPDADGLAVCQSLRRRQRHQPLVLMLTARDGSASKVAGYESGADDYVVKPFDPAVLRARLQALLRRARMGVNELAGSLLSYGDLLVNTDQRAVSRAGQPIKLSVKEYDLLLCLLRHQQQVLPRQRILHLVWGDSWVGDDNLLDVYIRYLRKKIERPDLDPLIHTQRGVGFVLK